MSSDAAVRLAYAEVGTGEPLVLIMGLGADRTAWEKHVAAYREHFRCIVVDNRGAGASPKPEGPYTTASMADDYAALMHMLGVQSAGVVGISMGGAIAQQLALRHPDLVARMVLVSSWAWCDPYTAEIFETLAKVRAAADPADFVRLLQLWIWSRRYLAENREELIEARNDPLAMPRHAFEAQCAASIEHDTGALLAELSVPTLITVGDEDVFTPLASAEVLHRGIRGSELKVFPGAAHAHHWEALREFNQYTAGWLSR